MDQLVRAHPDASETGQQTPPGGFPPAGEGPLDFPSEVPSKTCQHCGAGMAPDQDWCLECGTAAPGRLGSRPGWRAVATVVGLTLVLAGGAVAASYAALSSDSDRDASTPAPASALPVAAAPAPVVAPAPVAPPTGATGASGAAGVAPAVRLPKPKAVKPVPAAKLPTPAPATPVTPAATPVPAATTPTTTTTKTTTPKDTSTASSTTSTSAKTTPPAAASLTDYELGAAAGSTYDPYARISAQDGTPADALDDDADTTFELTAPGDGKPMQVGYLVDLGASKSVRQLELTTSTPGFQLEIYGADTSEIPTDILDTRWTHVVSRAKVDESSKAGNKAGDGVEKIDFPRGSTFRRVLLWITKPPSDGPTVGLTQVILRH